jgi:hypothetical protein
MIVYNGTYMLPDTYIQGDWIEFPITPFAYNGTDNLIVRVESDAGTQNNCYTSSADAARYPAQAGVSLDRTLSNAGALWDNKVDMRFWVTK